MRGRVWRRPGRACHPVWANTARGLPGGEGYHVAEFVGQSRLLFSEQGQDCLRLERGRGEYIDVTRTRDVVGLEPTTTETSPEGEGLLPREEGCTQFVHGRSRMTIDPRIPTMPKRSPSGFHQPSRHGLHQARSAVGCSASRTKGDLHPSKKRS